MDPAATTGDWLSHERSTALRKRRPCSNAIFTCGDGLVSVNGDPQAIGPEEAPPYLGYALLGGEGVFTVRRRLPASGLDSLALGTDGALDLLPRLDELSRDERVFRNPDGLRRRLVLLGRQGLFADDATLVLLRRTP